MTSVRGTRFGLGVTPSSGVDLRTEGILPSHCAQRRCSVRWTRGGKNDCSLHVHAQRAGVEARNGHLVLATGRAQRLLTIGPRNLIKPSNWKVTVTG